MGTAATPTDDHAPDDHAPDEAGTDRPGSRPAGAALAGPPRTAGPDDAGGLSDRALLLIVAALTLPILWMGYGTDIDVANVLEAAETLRSGSYEPSRTPGAPVFEALVAVLDPLGGHLLVNLATAAAAGALVVGIARLVRAWGHRNGDLLALAFLVSPVTIVASTGLADFIWALAFFVWGAVAHLALRDDTAPPEAGNGTAAAPIGTGRRLGNLGRSLLPGVLFGLAIGVRSSTGFLILAFLVADGWDRPHRARCLRTAGVAVPLGAALFIPSWLAFDRTLGFLETAEGYRGFFNNLGLFVYKNYIVAGFALIAVFAVASPALLEALRRWGRDPMLRFAVLALLLSQGLFFQLPWKTAHLLPALLAAILWLGCTGGGDRRRFLWVLVAAVAVNGLVTFRPFAPDRPDEATTGDWNPAVTAGLLVNDIDCRREHMRLPPTSDNVEAAWSCHLRPLRGAVDPD